MDIIIASVFLLSVGGFVLASIALYANRNKSYTGAVFVSKETPILFIDRFVDDFEVDTKSKKKKDKGREEEIA